MRDDGGHFRQIQARTASLVENARQRGMSESALARLPKPTVVRRDVLPPVVLATKAHVIDRVHQAQGRAAGLKSAARRAAIRPLLKRVRPARLHLANGRADGEGDRALFEQIVDLAAASSGVTSYEIHDFKRERKTVLVRHICWRLLREFTGLSSCAIARLTGRGCHSSTMNGIARALETTNTPQGAALYWELRTKLSAAGHRIVDDLEKKRGRS